MTIDIQAAVAEATRGSEDGRLNFPQVLGLLMAAGVEGYLCDLRRDTKTYYLPDGQSIEVDATPLETPVALAFDAAIVAEAVGRSQRGAHDYKAFCEMVMAAGCAGYIVSMPGRRVVYFGRTAEIHVEHFPPA